MPGQFVGGNVRCAGCGEEVAASWVRDHLAWEWAVVVGPHDCLGLSVGMERRVVTDLSLREGAEVLAYDGRSSRTCSTCAASGAGSATVTA